LLLLLFQSFSFCMLSWEWNSWLGWR